MRRAGEPLRDRIEKNQRERYGREDARQPINCARGQQKPGTTENQQNHGRQFWCEQVSRGRARVALIERPINDAIKEHCGRSREDHAKNYEQQNAQRRISVGRNNQRTERER